MKALEFKIKDPLVLENVLALSVFFLPLFQVASLICWGLLLIVWIYQKKYKNIFSNLKSNPQLALFFSLYLFYLIGMFWTEDKKAGWEDLSIKIPLLIFPVIFSSINLSKESYRKTGIALIAGCTVALLICFFHSLSLYIETGDIKKFYYVIFSIFLHPTYFTMYLNLALLFLVQDTVSENKIILHSGKIRILLFFILMTGVILLNARLAMTTVFITLFVFGIAETIKRNKTKQLLMRFIIQIVLIVGIVFSLLRLYNRFDQIANVVQNKNSTDGVLDTAAHVYYNSTVTRLALMKNGITVFKNNFIFGVGSGDVIQESVKELNRSKLDYLSKHYTGAHNQYLQTAMSIGIFGLILLVLCITFPLVDYYRSKNYLAICFVIIVFINAFGDTILRASSLYFFVFFGCYLYVQNKENYFFNYPQKK